MALDYLGREAKKLLSMSLLVLLGTRLIGINWIGSFIFIGIMLLSEHLIVYGRMNFWDFLGHEWLGFLLISVPLFFVNAWELLSISILAFLIGCEYNKDAVDGHAFKYAISKLRHIFK